MKETINVKSNGLRNELKEIRKGIDKLTSAFIEIHIAQTNRMKMIITIALVVTLGSCASQNTMMTEYRELTKNVCVDNEHEVLLAQHLYNKMKELKYNR